MINKIDAILNLVPNAKVTVYSNNVVEWHSPSEAPVTDEQIASEMIRLQAEAEAAKQAKLDARQSALNKLMALGLTEEEALALGVK